MRRIHSRTAVVAADVRQAWTACQAASPRVWLWPFPRWCGHKRDRPQTSQNLNAKVSISCPAGMAGSNTRLSKEIKARHPPELSRSPTSHESTSPDDPMTVPPKCHRQNTPKSCVQEQDEQARRCIRHQYECVRRALPVRLTQRAAPSRHYLRGSEHGQ